MNSVYAFFTAMWNSFGLFYFIGFSICVVIYACWARLRIANRNIG